MQAGAVVMIMAGGRGSRLGPLTCHRSKPAVPFGGRYRIVDFVLSNFVNSGFRRIYVLTQYMASSLIKHLSRNWRLSSFGEYIEVVPAQMRMGEFWYRGTADSVFQNFNLVRDERADRVLIFGGDHIYKMDIGPMDEFHRDTAADLTIAAFPVPRHEATQFGVLDVAADGRVIGFVEKSPNPPGMPGREDWSLASMGNYIFRTSTLFDALYRDAEDPKSRHDFGRDVIPKLVEGGARVFAYDFGTNRVPGEVEGQEPYWRDVGTLDSYFQASMDLRARLPTLNMYNRSWLIHGAPIVFPPARFVRDGPFGPASDVEDSLVSEGSIVSSSLLREALIGYDCFVHSGSIVEQSILFSGCDIGARARVRKVILDKNCKVAPDARIGFDAELDRKRFPFITESGVVVLPKGTHVPREGPIQLATDIAEVLEKDPELSQHLKESEVSTSDKNRHSYTSAGPRFRMYSGDPVAGLYDD